MFTYEQAVFIAAQKLEVQSVTRDTVDVANDGPLLCFIPQGRKRHKFFIIDPQTERGVVYTLNSDWAEDYMEARADFLSGLQSQNYRLEIFGIKDWECARQLLQGLRISLSNLGSLSPQAESVTDWLKMDLNSVQQLYNQENKLIFTNVDINGRYRILYAARYYKCFEFTLFSDEGSDEKAPEPINPQNDTLENLFEEYEEEGEDSFWEQLDDRPIK